MPANTGRSSKATVAVIVVVALSCQSHTGVVRQSHRAADHSRDLLTTGDFLKHPTLRNGTLFDAIVGLRPEFLSITWSGPDQRVQPAVIVDGDNRGGVDALRSISTSTVASVRLVRPREAVVRYGPPYRTGAIVVTLFRPTARLSAGQVA
jgi:hypothetical protein